MPGLPAIRQAGLGQGWTQIIKIYDIKKYLRLSARPGAFFVK